MKYIKSKRLALLAIVLLLIGNTVRAAILTVPIHFVDTSWDLTDRGGYDSIEVDIKPEIDESTPTEAYYFSNYISFTNYSGDNLGGGYAGFQTNGYSGSAWIGKMAIFSVWDVANSGVPEPGGYSTEFGGEGTGHSVRIPFNWQTGKTYRLKIYMDQDSISGNRLWGASLTDLESGAVTRIGRIYVPVTRGKITSPITFHEIYLSQANSCAEIRKSQVRFTNMTANNGSIKATSWNHYNEHQSTTCPGTNWVTDIDNGFVSGVGTTKIEYQNATAQEGLDTTDPAGDNSQDAQEGLDTTDPAGDNSQETTVSARDATNSKDVIKGLVNTPLSKNVEQVAGVNFNSFIVWGVIVTVALTTASFSLFIARKLGNRRSKLQIPIQPGPY